MRHRDRPDASAFESGTWTTDSVPCPPDPMLAAHVDGELDDARSAAIETHLDRCSICDAEARRLEGLSHMMRSWDVSHPEVVPPPRLASRILRDVEVESGVRRRETLASLRRLWSKAAAAALVVGVGAWLGARGAPREADPGRATRVAATPILSLAAAPVGTGSSAKFSTPGFSGLAERVEVEHIPAALAALLASGPAADLSVLSDPAAKAAFVRWAQLAATSERLGEKLVFVDGGRAIPSSAVGAYEGFQRWRMWVESRERRALEPLTRDPSASGVPLSKWFPLPSESAVADFWNSLPSVTDAAKRRHGGTAFRALRERSEAKSTPTDPSADPVIDLAEAVRSGSVRLLEDLVPSADVVVVQVRNLDAPVLVPAGELLSGGLAPRVVARGTWLPASAGSDTYQARLVCRALGSVARTASTSPAPTGLLAGPALRGALARGESAEGIRAIVRAQWRSAALDRGDAAAEPDLLRLYVLETQDAADLLRRARDVVARLGDDARGFVATDAGSKADGRESDGRFQGQEIVGIDGPSRRLLLVRLVAGYLAEAGSRSSVDGPRSGVDARDVLSVLARRPVRLTPLATSPTTSPTSRLLLSEEPRTGVAFEALLRDDGNFVLLSGLLPDVR